MRKPHRVLLLPRPSGGIQPAYLTFAGLYLIGVIAGHLIGNSVTDLQHQELLAYLRSYAQCAASTHHPSPVQVLFSYYRGPLALFLAGFAICGVWLIPLLVLGQGFSLAFSVNCFAVSLGRSGVMLAIAAFGVRCLFVIPCSLYLATKSWPSANHLRLGDRTKGKGKVSDSGIFPMIVCGIVLLIGCIIEISLVPRYFYPFLSKILS